MNKIILSPLKEFLTVLFLTVLGCSCVIFSLLYLNTFENGIIAYYLGIIQTFTVSIITIITVLAIIFLRSNKSVISKTLFITLILLLSFLMLFYFLTKSGFFEKIDSVESFREFIASFKGKAVFIFIILQFLQVVVLPLPSFITVGAGVLLFGAFLGAIYSVIGILLGSICAYFIGRLFGYKVASWLVGHDDLEKWIKKIKGKDKVLLTFMFLFPFFPDDILCFVAGITKLDSKFFILMVLITRLITVFTSSYSMNNSLIPYNTWWGILIWILLFGLTVILTVLIYKKGDKIQQKFFKSESN